MKNVAVLLIAPWIPVVLVVTLFLWDCMLTSPGVLPWLSPWPLVTAPPFCQFQFPHEGRMMFPARVIRFAFAFTPILPHRTQHMRMCWNLLSFQALLRRWGLAIVKKCCICIRHKGKGNPPVCWLSHFTQFGAEWAKHEWPKGIMYAFWSKKVF